jgi:hypothetical protein
MRPHDRVSRRLSMFVFDLVEWLTRLGLPQYAEVFRANDIDPDVLRCLSSEDLKELGGVDVPPSPGALLVQLA